MIADLPAPDAVRDRLLDALRHEDDQGLWEVVWVMNGQGCAAPVEMKVQLARDVVLKLLGEGRVELWHVTWPGTTARELTPDELRRLTSEDAPWCDPANCDLLVEIRLPGHRNELCRPGAARRVATPAGVRTAGRRDCRYGSGQRSARTSASNARPALPSAASTSPSSRVKNAVMAASN